MSLQDDFWHTNPATQGRTLAIVVGGGPAPGINGVIRAATIEARKNGMRVLGILEGFRHLSEGRTDMVQELTIDDVSRWNNLGGTMLKTSRVNPTKSERMLRNVVHALTELSVDYLVTIGGDDTAFTASRVDELAGSRIQVAHVPKTIDNDLPLPGDAVTFGFTSAASAGAELVRDIMEDARSAERWYYIVAMGRKAGHLAWAIGEAAGATLTVIPEEFRQTPIRFQHIVDLLEGAVVKRLAQGKGFGVAVLAEGLGEIIAEEDFKDFKEIERDEHGHVRLAELPLGRLLVSAVRSSLKARGVGLTFVEKNIGYELRCKAPVPFDMSYTQALGFAAAHALVEGGTGMLVHLEHGRLAPIAFRDIMDSKTGRTKVRMVDTQTDRYRIAREYMVRLEKRDFDDAKTRAILAQTANMTEEEFVRRFRYVAE